MSKVKERFFPYDASKYLEYDEDIAAYLAAALDDEDPRVFNVALGDVLRAGNVSQVAREVGVTREGLYKAFSADGNPSFSTVTRVMRALGLRMSVLLAASAAKREADRLASARAYEAELDRGRIREKLIDVDPLSRGRRPTGAPKERAATPASGARKGEKRSRR